MNKLRGHFRRNLLAGIAILVPVWLTVKILWIVITLIGHFLSPAILSLFRSHPGVISFPGFKAVVTLLSAVITLVILAVVGWAATKIIGRRLVRFMEKIMERIPIVHTIYDAIRKFTKLFMGDGATFQKVVLVEPFVPGIWAIGFVTSEERWDTNSGGAPLIGVFVPTVPNPTTGFYFFISEDKIRTSDLSVERALQLIVSCGTISKLSQQSHLFAKTNWSGG